MKAYSDHLTNNTSFPRIIKDSTNSNVGRRYINENGNPLNKLSQNTGEFKT